MFHLTKYLNTFEGKTFFLFFINDRNIEENIRRKVHIMMKISEAKFNYVVQLHDYHVLNMTEKEKHL